MYFDKWSGCSKSMKTYFQKEKKTLYCLQNFAYFIKICNILKWADYKKFTKKFFLLMRNKKNFNEHA